MHMNISRIKLKGQKYSSELHFLNVFSCIFKLNEKKNYLKYSKVQMFFLKYFNKYNLLFYK